MFPWGSEIIERQRRLDEIDLAEQQRRINAALRNGSSPAARPHQRLVISTGRMLVNWGLKLQSRYDHGAAATLSGYGPSSEASPCP